MLNQLSRTEMLIGTEGINKLKNARVIVFGIGGVGGYAIEALSRVGVGCIGLVDHDTVCITNLNRQLHATRKTVGRLKTDVAEERIREINPSVVINKFPVFYAAENTEPQLSNEGINKPDSQAGDCSSGQLFYTAENSSVVDIGGYDYIIDAIDTVSSKLALIKQAYVSGIPIISCMGAGNKFDPTAFKVADIYETSVCPLAKVIRRELRKCGIDKLKVVYSTEPAVTPIAEDLKNNGDSLLVARRQIPGSNSYVPAVMGLIAAGEVINSIIGFHSFL